MSSAVRPVLNTVVMLTSHDALRCGGLPGVSLAARARHREVEDDVLPPQRVFGVIVVALIFGKVDKHLKEQKEHVEAEVWNQEGLLGGTWSSVVCVTE